MLQQFDPRNRDLIVNINGELIHRDEADMNRLFETSKFGRPCTNIRFEQQGVNLFAEGARG